MYFTRPSLYILSTIIKHLGSSHAHRKDHWDQLREEPEGGGVVEVSWVPDLHSLVNLQVRHPDLMMTIMMMMMMTLVTMMMMRKYLISQRPLPNNVLSIVVTATLLKYQIKYKIIVMISFYHHIIAYHCHNIVSYFPFLFVVHNVHNLSSHHVIIAIMSVHHDCHHCVVIKPFYSPRSQGCAGPSTSSLSQSATMTMMVNTMSIVMTFSLTNKMIIFGAKKMLTSRVMNSLLMRKSWIFLMSIPSFT